MCNILTQLRVNMRKWEADRELSSKSKISYSLRDSINIPESADMNTYIEPGNYCCNGLTPTTLKIPHLQTHFCLKLNILVVLNHTEAKLLFYTIADVSHTESTLLILRHGRILYIMTALKMFYRHTSDPV